ncbi:MAG: ABC transporter permease [Lentimicrobium sp.]|jgi:putative ABC transport system permease protein|uniref:ABC transporter permease n=1 Tax=Lentimicrobium sp. TaxID=2034841 RepID=UPI0025EB8154|nr:ABC transporter permease [Lentimicrobium sp.]MCO5258324.1 ABC transporter permease [Lentimicrobium sp.]MCO5262600.1 ABC transporter permease [Lentimicrobium sp.]HPF65310.1 ABC transporter permease [Lentimicrobium sp.]
MFANYLKTALRSLMRQKNYALINLAGLSFGIAAFILIMLYVQHELKFDHHLSKRDRIFRVVEIQNEPGVGEQHVAITMGPLAKAMLSDFPQVKNAVRLMSAFNVTAVSRGEKSFREDNLYYADPSVIDMFDISFIYGDPAKAMQEPRSVVLSRKVAEKYFGDAAKAMGNTLLFDKTSFTITGVMDDQPETTHFFFDMLVPIATAEALPAFEWMKGWNSNSLVTYVELDRPSSAAEINMGFDDFLKRYAFSKDDGWQYLEMYLQPLSEVYLKSGHIKFQNVTAMGDASMVNVFIVISILILLIACVNFINISIARSVKRSREVGMRKVLGADRGSLIIQFISESAIITLTSVVLALGIVELVLPELNKLLGTVFTIDFISNPMFNAGLLLLFIVISLVSGSYPAFYLSRLHPIAVLRGISGRSGPRSGLLSKVLVVFQFIISVGLLLAVFVIRDQVNFIRNKDLGIQYTNRIFVGFGESGFEKIGVIKQELMQHPAIQSVSGCSYVNGVAGSQGPVFVDDSANTKLFVRYGFVDEDFFRSMDVEFADGRDFNGLQSGDINRAVIVNQATVSALGWDNALGRKFVFPQSADSSGKAEIIGVVKDYHYYSLRSPIEPAVWIWSPERFRGVVVKYANSGNRDEIRSFIESKWTSVFPGLPVQMTDATNYLTQNYKGDQTTFTLFIYFTMVSLLLSCLGLFGLTSLLIEQRTRVIGIRKVMGGTVSQIAIHLVKDYLLLVFTAGIIALPAGYFLLQKQLDEFAYHISINVIHLIVPVLLALLIAFLTIVFKAYRAANANPVVALKYE